MVRFTAFLAAGLALAGMVTTVLTVSAQSVDTSVQLAFTKCDPTAQYPISVRSIQANLPLQRLDVAISVTAVSDVTAVILPGARATISTWAGPVTVRSEIDVCTEASLSCPISLVAGKEISLALSLPRVIIQGRSGISSVNIINADNSVLFCFNTNVPVGQSAVPIPKLPLPLNTIPDMN
ncbi:hypothetical protein THASP1DRAFT_24362 [Thamnocephalis sphaerospora]|uniref:MD-2-related lipid-recognition domain-containing protein n=1 Tax=Thamnocephalis sphaerospora TaxID=78915 RepID=A0A4P9XNU1_9FUNG|nr:hypothetical protein THASP1DRAFT_24362 [Thamnocephalis sphaerospora]|eukprot:RKP07502.1 hypothetical protein THASP1DRAFT_24362 [Thamnocephalis sphaerospora]